MTISRRDYVSVHGPTTGDRVVLGDTGLVVEVESDSQRRGDEFIAGFGKTARDGLHLQAVTTRQSCDLVVSNVLVIDAVLGIRSASPTVASAESVAPATPTPSTGSTWSSETAPRSSAVKD